MIRAYFVVDADDGLSKSGMIDIPEGLSKEDAIVFVHGCMFECDWCPGTDHAIYLDDGSGYEAVYDEGDVISEAYAQHVPHIRLVQDNGV